MSINENDETAASRARDLRLIAPYTLGRTLRRWYLRKLGRHYMISANVESELSLRHAETAAHFYKLARAAKVELDRIEGQ